MNLHWTVRALLMLQTVNILIGFSNMLHILWQYPLDIIAATDMHQDMERGQAAVMSKKKIYGFINDFMFKFVFGERKDRKILTCLVNALLKRTGKDRIREIRILDPFNRKKFEKGKLSIVDMSAQDEKGRLYNIEVQLTPQKGYISRVLYYAGNLFCGQLNRDKQYADLRKTISISILDFTIFRQTEALHNLFSFRNAQTGEVLTDILELHFIELVKFREKKAQNLVTPFERWLHILKFGDIYKRERITRCPPGRRRD